MTPASLFSLLIDFDPTVLPDRKIHGGLQQIHSKVAVSMSKNGRNFDFRAPFG